MPKLTKELAVSLEIKYQQPEAGCFSVSDCLLNFTASLDMASLQREIGAVALWTGQFNGTKDEKLHLHWPETYNAKVTPWWENPMLRKEGFDVLSVDLGVRYAAAWSLTHVAAHNEGEPASGCAERFLGGAGGFGWYGRSCRSGLIRLDGEKTVGNGDSGIVRKATEEEKRLIAGLFKEHGMESLLLEDLEESNIIDLNNKSLRLFRRLLSRYRAYFRYYTCLCFGEESEKELAAMESYFGEKRPTVELIPGIRAALKKKDRDKTKALLGAEVYRMRELLPQVATTVTNLLLPRRKGSWKWEREVLSREGVIGAGVMKPTGNETYVKEHYIYRMGGLSVARLSQLEELRQRLQSMNRALSALPGQKALNGRDARNMSISDPCPDIRRKIENVREARVNEMSHAIVAQALGVRLIQPSRKGRNMGGRDVFHGEYERIPGRKPVSFVVLENLSKYRTNNAHSRRENSTLMRWSHRQLAAKIVQLLEEVFGIPVLFTHAAYTSKFDSISPAPGFRADVMTPARLQMGVKEEEIRGKAIAVYSGILAKLHRGIDIYMPNPDNGGEYFVSCTHGGETVVRNADINAAVNISLACISVASGFAFAAQGAHGKESKGTSFSPDE